jgi:UDP-glucuronate 4-epimerase
MKILVTGAAGFVGSYVAAALALRGDTVVGIDNLNSYYDPNLKSDRLKQITDSQNFSFTKMDISDRSAVEDLFKHHAFERVVHLAAQAGVRYSIDHPHEYIDANIVGFMNVLEGCRQSDIKHFVYASSSSVYGTNAPVPFSETDRVDRPVSLYAATKKSNELIAYSYAHLFRIPVTGLRFFTVYGPWGRPDMAYFSFTKNILEGTPITVFNNGLLARDFTYIDDIVTGVLGAVDHIPQTNDAPYTLYNIGNNRPVKLLDFIETIERATGRKAHKIMLPMQPGDVLQTYANIDAIHHDLGFQPKTDIATGIGRFVAWYREYYKI